MRYFRQRAIKTFSLNTIMGAEIKLEPPAPNDGALALATIESNGNRQQFLLTSRDALLFSRALRAFAESIDPTNSGAVYL